jgi:hypothetical protein
LEVMGLDMEQAVVVAAIVLHRVDQVMQAQ